MIRFYCWGFLWWHSVYNLWFLSFLDISSYNRDLCILFCRKPQKQTIFWLYFSLIRFSTPALDGKSNRLAALTHASLPPQDHAIPQRLKRKKHLSRPSPTLPPLPPTYQPLPRNTTQDPIGSMITTLPSLPSTTLPSLIAPTPLDNTARQSPTNTTSLHQVGHSQPSTVLSKKFPLHPISQPNTATPLPLHSNGVVDPLSSNLNSSRDSSPVVVSKNEGGLGKPHIRQRKLAKLESAAF